MSFKKLERVLLDIVPVNNEQKQVLQRRLNKLKRDPIGFIEGSYAKRKDQARKYLPIKHDGKYQYTAVSAVYNVEKYLDEYFESLVNQSLNFKKHIHLILVDDGSTDNSADIIKKWQKKYPNNITYIYKENGGISSARNLGLQHVQTEWVTFIDSDDFVEYDYFKIVDDELSKDSSIEMAVGNLRFYFEDNKSIKDTHFLKYRFKNEVNKVDMTNLDVNINLFVTVSFFKTEYLKKYNILFDERIKPNFEDGKFLADYFLSVNKGKVAYLKNALFNYRKRGDGSSTIDGSWSKKEKFLNVFSFGYIPLLQSYKNKHGKIPKNIQWTVLYELGWHFKMLLNSDYKLEDVLSDEEIENYHSLICETLSYIDDQHIINFNLIGIWFLYKVGIIGLKGKKVPFNTAYIENIDREQKQILIAYHYTQDHDVTFRLDDNDIIPQHWKIADYSFAKKVFVHEVRAWIPYNSFDDQLTVKIDGKLARLSLFGKQQNSLKIADIIAEFKPSEKYKTDGSWIFMDRDIQADDNAEHFYRYVRKNHPEQKCYFALNQDSHDWNRLQKEGFLLLNFGSKEYENRLRKASRIISSHFDEYVQDYFNDEYEHSKKFIFLQHGVIQNDLSRFMNRKRNLLAFITSTKDEYDSIVQNHSPYKVGDKEVVLTGLARHDELLRGNCINGRTILIMPTWRSSILGKATKTGNAREFNEDFMQTGYAKHWADLLHSHQLKALAEQYDYKIIFAPHANIEPYLHLFQLPEYVQTWKASSSKTSIQKLFQVATVMITDYSSVAFEMAFLQKPVLYYQFDRNEIFSGTHVIRRGYFDYERDGFGSVSENEIDLLDKLKYLLESDDGLVEPYATRIREAFAYRDGKNCERIYQAIQNMDRLSHSVNIDNLQAFTEMAFVNRNWQVLEERSHWLKQVEGFEKYWQYYYLAIFKQNKLGYLSSLLEKDPKSQSYWRAKMGLHLNNPDDSLAYFEQNPSEYLDDRLLCLLYSASKANINQHKKFQLLLAEQLDNDFVLEFIHLSDMLLKNEIESFGKKVDELSASWDVKTKNEYKLDLLAARLFASIKDFKKANGYLSDYWKCIKNDPAYFLAAADVSYANNNHERVVHKISQGFKGCFNIISSQELNKYASSFKRVARQLEALSVQLGE